MRIIPNSTGVTAPADTETAESSVASRTHRDRQIPPARPPVGAVNGAPVITRRPPPFSVRLSEFLWILTLLSGALAVVYDFVIRKDQTPLIVDAVKAIQAGRPDATYDTAADIVYWSVFWVIAGTVVIQVALLVSFMTRKSGARWWQLATVVLQSIVYLLAAGLVAGGDRGELLRSMLLVQVSLGALALLVGSFSRALAWTARRQDVRRAGDSDGADL